MKGVSQPFLYPTVTTRPMKTPINYLIVGDTIGPLVVGSAQCRAGKRSDHGGVDTSRLLTSTYTPLELSQLQRCQNPECVKKLHLGVHGPRRLIWPGWGTTIMIRPGRGTRIMIRPRRGTAITIRPRRGTTIMIRPRRGTTAT